MSSLALLKNQLDFFESTHEELEQPPLKQPIRLLDLDQYDKILASNSSGKDSTAQVLMLLKLGVPKERIELHHQCVDGGPGQHGFFDWPITENYLRAFSKAFDIPLYLEWRQEGLKGELYRENAMSKDMQYERDGEVRTLETKLAPISTRRKWPAKSGNLAVRWCSGNAKISVFRRMVNNTFSEGKYLVLTGERRQESAARAKYLESEIDSGNTRSRLVHRWRSVIDYTEEQIWDLYAEYGVQPHPAYHLGWSRVSCMTCVFSGPDHWATIRQIDPERFRWIAETEKELNHTIDANMTVTQMADKGTSFLDSNPEAAPYIAKALGTEFSEKEILVDPKTWKHPIGAFRGNGGGAI